jgi:hypothetical protein
VDEYYIEAGVHRAVAFRENGVRVIPAILYEPGRPPRLVWVTLGQLHSARRSISRSDPRHNYPALEQAIGTALGRSRMPAIELQPLGLAGQPSTVPLDQVTIEA